MKISGKTQKSPTRDQVAKEAGVSSATVSRVYNNPESVSADRQQSVIQAAEKLGYTPNKAASALRRNGSGIITLLEIKKKKRDYYWAELSLFKWFYSEVLHAVKDVVDTSMYQLNLATAGTAEELKTLQGTTDGLICFDVDMAEEAELIADSGLPFIIGHHTKNYRGLSRCSTDNFAGGVVQAELLKKNGCRRPAYITAHLAQVEPHRDRLEGFCSVFGAGNVRVIESGVGRAAGYKAGGNIAAELKNGGIDGIAAVNDITAAGAGYAVMEAGLKVQKDIPLAGYDNMPFGIALPFRLMSVDIKPADIYRNAAEMMLNSLTGSSESRVKVIRPTAVSSIK